MMADLISREEAISTIKSMLYQTALNSVEGDEKAAQLYADIADNRVEIWLKLVDSVSAIPVVRCKDCKYSDVIYDTTLDTMPLKCLNIRYGGVMPDWYCEHGERRDSE